MLPRFTDVTDLTDTTDKTRKIRHVKKNEGAIAGSSDPSAIAS